MTGWREVSFEPLDVITASDLRTMDTGASAHLGSLAPNAFAGLIRTAILEQAGFTFGDFQRESDRAKAAAGDIGHPLAPAGLSDFQVAAPLMKNESGTPFLPLPRFCVWDGERPAIKEELVPIQSRVLADDRFSNLFLLSSERDREPDPRWASIETVCYLLGKAAIGTEAWEIASLRGQGYPPIEDFRANEWHWGHERSPSGVAADAKLWSRPVERFKIDFDEATNLMTGSSYAALVRGTESLLSGDPFIGKLGGDGHRVRVSIRPADDVYSAVVRLRTVVDASLDSLRGLLLYCATPAIFADGWRPAIGDSDGLRLIAAAAGKPLVIGGWDLAQRRPRSARRAVPAGSSYFYIVEDIHKAKEFIARHHWRDQLSIDGSVREGFGLALCGVWDARAFVQGGS